ncbi:hypothetical protein GOAMR_68_00040 [Gordonia amarae NBRC 15530]|uniref:Uncharacterized protein n=1 Tax=Gordonia amarae NBRC 15530 TaxID=1075090 RepID=G7GV24_9ACTN|nr:hypothetical protein GOAMR_68_00040 [Gordonia amarae NBRC 15530]
MRTCTSFRHSKWTHRQDYVYTQKPYRIAFPNGSTIPFREADATSDMIPGGGSVTIHVQRAAQRYQRYMSEGLRLTARDETPGRATRASGMTAGVGIGDYASTMSL